MKYKLISVFLTGLLAAGLYAEAATVQEGMDTTKDIVGTEDIVDGKDIVVTEEETEQTEETALILAGGIGADLEPTAYSAESTLCMVPDMQTSAQETGSAEPESSSAESVDSGLNILETVGQILLRHGVEVRPQLIQLLGVG